MQAYTEQQEWKYRFYVVNRQQEFVYGFDVQHEAEEYAKRLNAKRHRKEYKTITYDTAMGLSLNLTPMYDEAWSANWVEPEAVGL